MRASTLFASVASLLLVDAAPLNIGDNEHRHMVLALYQDNDCQIPIPGDGITQVNSGTCDTNVRTGWSSAKIIENNIVRPPAGWPYGPEFYERNNCAVAQKRHGFSGLPGPCLKIGFIANAVGYF
ncbi:hypothetical protein F5B22DRAFT_642901 [Xylaria bambusicola]|uniref:uncharacterized protein n=1 Tax=Xylaria bambusicola TaxID=326684 RepID=UPI002008EAB7|nr:uncharacterized protein F5B22DRAFT_642901 [Xylaria bambusicola]KAI0523799.1 hypothetical protein F5B22DRAFT_642901 [Xylaria bambusicola]